MSRLVAICLATTVAGPAVADLSVEMRILNSCLGMVGGLSMEALNHETGLDEDRIHETDLRLHAAWDAQFGDLDMESDDVIALGNEYSAAFGAARGVVIKLADSSARAAAEEAIEMTLATCAPLGLCGEGCENGNG